MVKGLTRHEIWYKPSMSVGIIEPIKVRNWSQKGANISGVEKYQCAFSPPYKLSGPLIYCDGAIPHN